MKNRLLFFFAGLTLFVLQVLFVQQGLNWFVFLPFFRGEMSYFHVFGLMILWKTISMNKKKPEKESWTDMELLNAMVIDFFVFLFFGAALYFAMAMM